MSLALISHPDCLKHEMGAQHPEQPARLLAIEKELARLRLDQAITSYLAPLATRDELIRVHAPDYVDYIFQLSPTEGLVFLDADTAMNPHSLQAALRAAGGAVFAVDLIMKGEVSAAFCNVRPPGHHAERAQAMGFCFFNNVAVAVAHALEKYHLKRIAIVDFDVHHGNGTEDIFKNESKVLLCSSFQSPFYPFTGADTVSDHILNVPLPSGSDGKVFREHVEKAWFKALKDFKPELVFFSAGFDAHLGDGLASLALVEEDFAWLTAKVKDITSASSQGRIISLLEGGYNLDMLGRCAAAHVQALL